MAVDEDARRAGIRPGLRLSEAWAYLPNLTVQERDQQREQSALTRLACWAGSFTPEVCLPLPHTLLLEVAGSLQLFGDATLLFARVVNGCHEQGFTPQAALAPTPLAAQWLAFAGDARPCLEVQELPQRLACLPLAALALTAHEQSCLASLGADTLGSVLRLPRAGLARRLGTRFVTHLARALGELADPRPRFTFPERFSEELELPFPANSTQALIFTGRRLITTLCGWLAARNGGIGECTFEFEHERGTRQETATRLPLALNGVTRNAERLTHVFIERLRVIELPAAVERIRLHCDPPFALSGQQSSLFADRQRATVGDSLPELIERLQARLGREKVHGLSAVAGYRPENSSRPCSLVLPAKQTSGVRMSYPARNPELPARPLSLLTQPRLLREVAGRPQWGGPLRLLAGPERIESGWWDGAEPEATGDVRRDYFVALSINREWLWIFRSHAGWFLHGIFS